MRSLVVIGFTTLLLVANAHCESGHLELYSEATQIGTVGRRTFTNEQNQPTKVILYRAKRNPLGPGREDDIFPYEVRLFTYQSGKENWMGVYSADFQLQRSLETEYGADGQKRLMQWRDSDGIVRYMMLLEDGKVVSHIYFDDYGKKPTKVKGRIPTHIDAKSIQHEP